MFPGLGKPGSRHFRSGGVDGGRGLLVECRAHPGPGAHADVRRRKSHGRAISRPPPGCHAGESAGPTSHLPDPWPRR